VELTALGFVLLSLSMLFLLRPGILLQIVLLASSLGAAVPVIIKLGGEPFGLPSGFLAGLLFVAVVGLDHIPRSLEAGEREGARAVIPMILFTVAVLTGAYILPRLFAGEFNVWPQRVGILNVASPLAPTGGNITQSLYLMTNTAILALAALYVSRASVRPLAFVRAYLASGYIVVFLCLWQLVSKHTGIYYPSEFLYSNPRWAILTEQTFGNVNRINGPFTEPAALAAYLSGIIFACLWMLLRGHGGNWVRVLFVLAFAATLMSTSTTGILVVTIAIPAVLMRSATSRERRAVGLTVTGIVGGFFAIGVFTYLVLPSVFASVQAVVAPVIEQTLDKPESGSYIDRTTKDLDSLAILVPSFGFGAGWGSVRSSSLIPGVLGNGGLPGFILLGWFAIHLTRLVSRARRIALTGEVRVAMDTMVGSVLGTLCAAVLAAPTINDVDFFLRVAVIVGCAARICVDARGRVDAPVPVSLSPMPSQIFPRSGR
jgi:hypothetical protein